MPKKTDPVRLDFDFIAKGNLEILPTPGLVADDRSDNRKLHAPINAHLEKLARLLGRQAAHEVFYRKPKPQAANDNDASHVTPSNTKDHP